MRLLVVLYLATFCFLISCQKKTVPVRNNTSKPGIDTTAIRVQTDSILKIEKERKRKFPDVEMFSSFLRSQVKDSTTTSCMVVIKKERIFLDSLTLNIYRANNFSPFWNNKSTCDHIIELLHDSYFDGLNPKEYGIPNLDSLYKACFITKRKRSDTLYWKLELSITKNYLLYLHHLRFGKTNPEIIFKEWDYKRDTRFPYTSEQLSKFFLQDPDKLVGEFRPKYPIYEVLRSVLYAIESASKNKYFEWDPIPYIGKDLKLGDTSWVITKIKHRLLSISLGHENTDTTVFDKDLLEAVNYFQQHVGLTPTGKIDKTTIGKLNFTVEEIENVVRANMERCRWLLKEEFPEYYILVNIPDYTLRIYKNDKQVYKTKVVVGATNKETPIFHSKMTTVELNPHWTVPISISSDEFLPKLKADPTFLSRNNMELLQGDSVVHVTDFSSYSKSYFPFVIRQKPGEDNSLGVVKFLFPNPYSVYLHDTPAKSLFEKDMRAFSHGCIRVNKPLDMAAFILGDQGIELKDIHEIVKTGKNTPISLKTKIPVIITYWTCLTDQNNQFFFFKDIYGKDKLILKELDR